LKTIITNALGGAPDNTDIAVMTFAGTATIQLEFTQDSDSIAAAIKRINAQSSGNSCLNNALYESVLKLSGAPGRRAVVAFTASRDNCANRLYDDVVDLARQNRVQIYAVGLLGYSITEEELEAFTGPSGGFAEFKDESTLGFGFTNVMAALNSQWTARAIVFPLAGEREAVLTVNLSDETVLSSPPIPFTSPQDFIPPTEIHLKGTVQSTADGILFNLDIIQREKIRQLNVSIISNDTGQAVMAQALVTFSDVNALPAIGLIPGLEYTLIVNAIDDQGQPLSESSAEFTYEPPQAQLTVTGVELPTADLDAFVISVSSQNIVGAVKHKAWLMDEESQQRIDGTEITVPLGEPLLIPADGVRSGDYLVMVQALDSADTVLAETPPTKTTFTRPGLIDSISSTVSRSPLGIAGLTGFFCIAALSIIGLVAFVLPRRAARSGTVELVMPQKERRQAPAARRPSAPSSPPAAEQLEEPELQQRIPRRPTPQAAASTPPEIKRDPVQPKPTPELEPRIPEDTGPAANITILFPPMAFSANMDQPVFTIGRREGNDAVLPLDGSSGVSGQHLTITYKDGQYFAQDDRSTYGTTIEGEEMDKGKPYALRDGAVLSLGPKVKIEFQLITKTRKTS
jgi:predicted component of type VI protein secretion system